MIKNKKIYLLLFLLPLFYVCSSTVPETHFYMIDYPVQEIPNNSPPKYNVTLGVARFSADPLYAQERIVYRESHYEGKYYNYHQWVTPPAVMISDKIIEQLKTSNLFKHVVDFPRIAKVDYILRGTVKNIEEWDEGDQWFAKVKFDVELIDSRTQELVWQQTFSKKIPVAEKKPFEVVKGINSSVQECIGEVQQELNTIFGNL